VRFERVDNLEAYCIPPETGFLIPSVAVGKSRRFSLRKNFYMVADLPAVIPWSEQTNQRSVK
jgi:hypothetical protein